MHTYIIEFSVFNHDHSVVLDSTDPESAKQTLLQMLYEKNPEMTPDKVTFGRIYLA